MKEEGALVEQELNSRQVRGSMMHVPVQTDLVVAASKPKGAEMFMGLLEN
jgi:hypothetical protein